MDLSSDLDSLSMEEKVNIILKTVVKTNGDLNSLKESVQELKEENRQLKTKVDDLENKISTLETQNKENYLIFYGVAEMDNEDSNKLEEKILDIIAENVGIEDISSDNIEKLYRMGTSTNKKRPVAVKFANFKVKDFIYKNARNLKDSGYVISLYYSTRDQDERRKLLPYLAKAKINKKPADKIYLKKNKLLINNETFTIEQCESRFKNLEENITDNAHTRHRQQTTNQIKYTASTSQQQPRVHEQKQDQRPRTTRTATKQK